METFILGFLCVLILCVIIWYGKKSQRERVQEWEEERQELKERIDASSELFTDYNYILQCQRENVNITGVYVLWNKTKDIYYVGQSKNIIQRVYNHFNGRGNQAVHYDMLRGHDFSVRLISLKSSDFWNVDDQEAYYIKEYDSYNNGYNKNQGNHVGKEMGSYENEGLIPEGQEYLFK